MTFSKFEKYAAVKINNHASDVDVEALWNDILPHVQKGNSRRGGLIWFFVIGLLVVSATFFILKDSKSSGSENEISQLSSAGIITDQNDQKPSSSKETLAIPALKSENDNLAEKVAQISIPPTKKSKLIENNSPANSNSKKYKVINATPTSNVKLVTEEVSASNSVELQIVLEEEPVNQIIEPQVENTPLEKTGILLNNEPVSATFAQSETLIEKDELEIESLIDSTELILITPNAVNEEEEDRTRKRFKLRYGVGLYGGYSSSFSSLKAKDTMSADYLQMRLQTEEQLETIQMGFEGIVLSEVGVYLKTGLQYARIARKLSLNSTLEMVDSVHGIQRIYVNNNTNDTIFIYGQVPVTTRTTYNKTTYNYFHLVDIPVIVGYTYNNENWSFGVEGGALFNISTKSKGEIMNPEGEFYDMKADNLNWFKDNVGVSFTASVMAAYHLNDNFQIYLAPTARLESVFSTDDNPIDQKHGSLGFNIGARYFIGY